MFQGLSKSVDHLNETTKLAWCTVGRRQFCLKPGSTKSKLRQCIRHMTSFPISMDPKPRTTLRDQWTEDPYAFWEGEAFMKGGEEDEWEDWVGNEAL